MPAKLTRLTLTGFKSIKRLEGFEPGQLSVLIGANGAGKSNLISFFRALRWVMADGGNFQNHLTMTGRARSWLHDGPAVTSAISADMLIGTEAGTNEYQFGWEFAAGDTLYYNHERFRFLPAGVANPAPMSNCGTGHVESMLRERAEAGERTPAAIRGMLNKFVVHQFHNTSFTARMKQASDIATEGRRLKEDAGNLAAFLYRLRTNEALARHYQRIVSVIRQGLPFFSDFVLEPEGGAVLLQWKERNSDAVFGAHQASDGMLRYMALVTLLLQPADDLPDLLILDEPELGLHPYAITTIAALVKAASRRVQVLLATQSASFINEFDPQNVVVVERYGRESRFQRLATDNLKDWLKDYSLAELWEKNVLGGRPSWE